MATTVLRLYCLFILVLVTSCSPQGPTISIEADSTANINEDVRVAVRAGNITELTAFEVHLSFDPAVLEVVRLEEGDLVKADFTIQNTFDNAAGTIDYAVAQINRPPASGSGDLFAIVFHAKVPGSSPIHFQEMLAAPDGVILADSKGLAIQVVLKESTVRVK